MIINCYRQDLFGMSLTYYILVQVFKYLWKELLLTSNYSKICWPNLSTISSSRLTYMYNGETCLNIIHSNVSLKADWCFNGFKVISCSTLLSSLECVCTCKCLSATGYFSPSRDSNKYIQSHHTIPADLYQMNVSKTRLL